MNIKKLFPEKKLSKRSVMEFLDKKGFYVVLIFCVAIIGATAVYVTTHKSTSSESGIDTGKIIPEETSGNSVLNAGDNVPAQSSIEVKATGPDKSGTSGKVAIQNEKQAAKPGTNTSSAAKSAQAKTSEPKKTEPAKKQAFIMPVSGKVSFEFAQEKLVYSKTLDEWRTHSGVDLISDMGTTVKAVADGIVSEVITDPRFGITVLIDHQNGIKTVYANLASDDMVSTNQKIKQGDVIGCIGSTAAFESAEQTHLHFEVLKNDVPVDPSGYLPKQN